MSLTHDAHDDRHAAGDTVLEYHQPIDDEMAHERVTCPACHGAQQGPILERHETWALHECLDCGVQHFWPAKNPGPSYYQTNEMYRNRDLVVVDWLGWYHRAAIEHLPVRSGRLIDVGCGTGSFVAAAQKLGFEATGIDFAATAIEAGRRQFGIDRLYAMSIEDYRTQRDAVPFDVVTAFEILEHMDDSRAFVESLITLLKPGGHLVLSVPNRDRYPRLLDEGDLPPHHFTRWDASALQGLLRRHGVEPIRTIVCPTDVTLKAFFMHYVHFDIITRMLRRAESERDPSTRIQTAARARTLTRLKDRLLNAVSAGLSPLAAPIVRGPMIVCIGRMK